jgi:hypothetical protein
MEFHEMGEWATTNVKSPSQKPSWPRGRLITYCASKQDKDLKKREQKSIFLLTKRDQNCFLKFALLELCEQRKE